MYKKLYICSVK